jgi:hypothetical protein
MKMRVSIALSASIWLLVGLPPLRSQDAKDIVVHGQVQAGVHKFRLDDGLLYRLEIKAKGFVPAVHIRGDNPTNIADFAKERNTFRCLILPPKSGDYPVTVMPLVGSEVPAGLLDYDVTLRALALDTPILKKDDKLTADDPKYANPKYGIYRGAFKEYPLALKGGQTYVIEMAASRAAGNKLLPVVMLEDPSRRVVGTSITDPTASLVFRAPADGDYRVVAGTSYLTILGDYSLTVRRVKEDK